LVCSSIFHI
jgi:hypothetical protein